MKGRLLQLIAYTACCCILCCCEKRERDSTIVVGYNNKNIDKGIYSLIHKWIEVYFKLYLDGRRL